jgi:hypothetical protein
MRESAKVSSICLGVGAELEYLYDIAYVCISRCHIVIRQFALGTDNNNVHHAKCIIIQRSSITWDRRGSRSHGKNHSMLMRRCQRDQFSVRIVEPPRMRSRPIAARYPARLVVFQHLDLVSTRAFVVKAICEPFAYEAASELRTDYSLAHG